MSGRSPVDSLPSPPTSPLSPASTTIGSSITSRNCFAPPAASTPSGLGRQRLARGRVAIALVAGVASGSFALIGFGVDSLIEVLAGGVVVWLFTGSRVGSHAAERRAQQAISISFGLLAAYVTVEALRTIAAGHHPDASWIGISLAAFTAVTMPLLARAKGGPIPRPRL